MRFPRRRFCDEGVSCYPPRTDSRVGGVPAVSRPEARGARTKYARSRGLFVCGLVGVVLLLVSGLLLALGEMSHAQESQPQPHIVRGEIVFVDGQRLTVQTDAGLETLTLASDVRIIAGKRLLAAAQLRPDQRIICEVASTPQDATARLVFVLGSALAGERGITIQGIAQAAERGEPISLSNSDSDSTYPAVAVGADGRVRVVWSEGPSDSACDIMYTCWDGQTWTAPALITATAGLSWAPQVAVDLTGTVHVVWTESVNYVPRILYSRLEEGGGWSTPVILSGELTDSYFPDIVADSEGHLHVAWGDFPPYQNSTVRYVTGNGVEWSQPEIVANDYALPALAMDSDDVLHLAWAAGNVYHRQRVAGVWGAPEIVCEGDGCGMIGPGAGEPYVWEAAVAVAPDGTLHVAWRRAETNDNGDNIGEIFHRWRAEGGQWSEVSNVSQSTNHSYGLSLVADELGWAHAVWYELGYEGEFVSHLPGDHDPGVCYRVWTDGEWGESHYLFTSILSLAAYGSSNAAADEMSQVHVVWNEWVGDHTDIFYTSESPPSGLCVDVSVAPGTTLTLTDEGWPTPNPLAVTVTVGNNTTTTMNVSGTLNLGGASPPRFYIIADDEGNAGEEFSQTTYPDDFTVNLTPSSTQMFTWTVWVQPSEATTLQATAELNVAGTPQDTASVTIPQASIHPVVFLHGILGSMPPRNSVITTWPMGPASTQLDPFVDSYSPLINNLLKMGYEINETLFPVTYDWRQSNRESASHLKWALETYVPEHVSGTSYAVQDGEADVVVHSMGGLVLRTYVEGLATDGPYGNTVNKAIFIATPHRGFPATYRTWEGVTWEEYLVSEVPLGAGGVDISGITDVPNDTTLRFAMDELLWPYFILKRYDPAPCQVCYVSPAYWLPDPDIWDSYLAKLVRLGIAEFGEELYEALERHYGQDWPGPVTENWRLLWAGVGCPRTVLYDYTHDGDSQRAIGSLPEMLPPTSDGEYPEPATRPITTYLTVSGAAYPHGVQVNPLLEVYGLNEPSRVAAFADAIGLDNIYVIYGTGEQTAYAYEVDPPPAVDPWLLHLPTWWRNTRWINGEPQRPFQTNDAGDNLIPTYSTKLRDGGQGLLPDLLPENEVKVESVLERPDSAGHKGLPYSIRGQQGIGWALTGLGERPAPEEPFTFPLTTSYIPPIFIINNGDAILALLVWSPVDVLVTDPDGRRIGYDPAAGEIVNEIPNAFYSGNGAEEEFFLLPAGKEGDYTVTTTGTGSGPYAVSMHRVSAGQVWTMGIVGGEAQPGQVVTHTIPYSLPLQSTFFDDIENGTGNWDASSGWMPVTDAAHSPVTSWRGEATDDQATLTLVPAFDLSDAGYAQLHFWNRFAPGEGAMVLVEASDDGGTSWKPVWQGSRAREDWTPVEVDLTGYVGADKPPVRLRFRLVAGAETAHWWVDDVAVGWLPTQPEAHPLPFVDEMDGLDNWVVAGVWAPVSDTIHAGEQSWTTAEDGATLTLAQPLEAGDATRPVFSFWTRWTMPQPDAGYVEVSTDGGVNWTAVYTQTAFTPEWTRGEIVLEEYAGQRFLVRLRLSAPMAGGTGQAWWVDDVLALDWTPPVVHGLPFEDGFETDENWHSLRGWTATDQAHSGQRAQFAAADEATLQLVDELDLSTAVSPTLTFWERFTVPASGRGQVLVSADGGLHWQAVYTRTENVSAWEQATVDLSQFAGKRLQLAFYLERAEGEGVAGVIGEAVLAAAEPATDEPPTGSRSVSGRAWPVVTFALPAVLVAAVQTSRRRRAGYIAALATPVVLVCVISLACLWRGCVYPLTPAGKRAAIEARWARAEAVDEVIGGRVEIVVPARTGIGAALLSPDGRWLAWGVVQNRTDITAEGGPYLTDLNTGQQYEIPTEVGMSRWVNVEYLYLGGKLLHVPDRAIRELELRPAEMLTETFRTAQEVYVLVDGYEIFISTDPATPYKISYPDYYQVKETLPFSYTVVPRRWANPNGPVTSPDGNLIAVWAEHPEHERWYLEVQTPAGEVVASVYKRAWVPNIMGWGPDSRTLYFYETTTGALSDIYWPERPVLKLVVDYPPATPMPAGEGRVPGAGQLRLVAYRPAPVAQSGEQGWYVDDVSVVDLPTQTLTLSGSPASGVITATVPGEFSLVFDADYAWQPRSWYDLTTGPAQDLANKGSGSRTKDVLWSPGIASVMGQWLSIDLVQNASIQVVENSPARAVLLSTLPELSGVVTTTVYPNGSVFFSSLARNETGGPVPFDWFKSPMVNVEDTLAWYEGDDPQGHFCGFQRTAGEQPYPNLVATNAADDTSIGSFGPGNRYWYLPGRTLQAGEVFTRQCALHLKPNGAPPELAQAYADDYRHPGLVAITGTVVGDGYAEGEGAYTVAAVDGQAAFYPTGAYLRHAPAFVIENWPAETFVIRKGGVEIASGAAPNRPWANAFFDAAHQRLVFQYLPDIEPGEPTEQRIFEVSVGGRG